MQLGIMINPNNGRVPLLAESEQLSLPIIRVDSIHKWLISKSRLDDTCMEGWRAPAS